LCRRDEVNGGREPAKSVLILDASTALGGAWPGYWSDAGGAITNFQPSPHRAGTTSVAVFADGHAEVIENLKPSVHLKAY